MNIFRKIQIAVSLNPRPRKGETVKVAVGFSSHLNEGVVREVYKDYCWIDEFHSNGKFYRSFTASFSYCYFIINTSK
jgi:hypothetical protein